LTPLASVQLESEAIESAAIACCIIKHCNKFRQANANFWLAHDASQLIVLTTIHVLFVAHQTSRLCRLSHKASQLHSNFELQSNFDLALHSSTSIISALNPRAGCTSYVCIFSCSQHVQSRNELHVVLFRNILIHAFFCLPRIPLGSAFHVSPPWS